MKVLVLDAFRRFSHSEPQALYAALLAALNRTEGVDAEGFRIPLGRPECQPNSDIALDDMVMARSLRVGFVDRLLVLDPTLALAEHPNKVLWLTSGMPRTCAECFARGGEWLALKEARRIFATEGVVARRLGSAAGVRVAVLRPPLSDAAGSTTPKSFDGSEPARGSNDWSAVIEELLR